MKMNAFRMAFAILFALSGEFAQALVTTNVGSGIATATCSAVDSSDSIFVAGYAGAFYATHYNSAGVLDTTYGTSGKASLSINGAADTSRGCVLQSDGKFVIVGVTAVAAHHVTTYHSVALRFNSDGTVDTGFGTSGSLQWNASTVGNAAWAVAQQADGKLVVAWENEVSGVGQISVTRLTTAGAVDTTFGTSGKVTTSISGGAVPHAIQVQSDGNILVGGQAGGSIALVRFTSAGALDTTFGISGTLVSTLGGISPVLNGMVLRPVDSNGNQAIVIGGSTNSGSQESLVAQFTNTGAMDSSFNGGAPVLESYSGYNYPNGNAVALDGNGNIVLTGSILGSAWSFLTARFVGLGSSAGQLDTTFNSTGYSVNIGASPSGISAGTAAVVQSGGQVVNVGWTDSGSSRYFGLLGFQFDGSFNF